MTLKLLGTVSNRAAIGTRVLVKAGCAHSGAGGPERFKLSLTKRFAFTFWDRGSGKCRIRNSVAEWKRSEIFRKCL